LLHVLVCAAALAQEPAAKPGDAAPPSEKTAPAKSEEKSALPFQIQLLETHVRFESNGDSRKEVHTVVKINDLAGARQFSRLGFDYNRAFQQVEIPLVKISHENGGTSEILPSAITDAPNPAVEKFPAYQDVRVKSVRILGLQDGDTLEYRVITTTTKHPLAPDFWLEHSFDRSGQVVEELYVLDLPASRKIEPVIGEKAPASSMLTSKNGETQRTLYEWKRSNGNAGSSPAESEPRQPDVVLSTFTDWKVFSTRFANAIDPEGVVSGTVSQKAAEITKTEKSPVSRLEAIYNLVSQKIATVDLPLGAAGYRTRDPGEILMSGYATEEDKAALFGALARATYLEPLIYLTFGEETKGIAFLPSRFQHILLGTVEANSVWMDPSSGVAPFGMISSAYRGKTVFCATAQSGSDGQVVLSYLPRVPETLPFAAVQTVNVKASLGMNGQLSAKVKYMMRGDNELLLRLAFHQTPRERWKEVAGLLALSDGFRGQITNVTASDPMATEAPFTVEYEITQAKFVDWSKKPVRIPALLPQIALPDAPGKTPGKIELGTPLDVQTSLTLKLPEGTTVQTPAATSVARDYATFASKYDGHLNTVTVSRHIDFLKREIPSERAADYNAFLRAVQNDQAQVIVLSPLEAGTEN
jgi:hypothetical protein